MRWKNTEMARYADQLYYLCGRSRGDSWRKTAQAPFIMKEEMPRGTKVQEQSQINRELAISKSNRNWRGSITPLKGLKQIQATKGVLWQIPRALLYIQDLVMCYGCVRFQLCQRNQAISLLNHSMGRSQMCAHYRYVSCIVPFATESMLINCNKQQKVLRVFFTVTGVIGAKSTLTKTGTKPRCSLLEAPSTIQLENSFYQRIPQQIKLQASEAED